MKTASGLFSSDDRERVEAAVAKAEGTTSAEIVPVVCTASGRYDRAEDIAGLWLGAILLCASWLWLPWQRGEGGDWGLAWERFQLPLMLLMLIGGFVLGAFIASRTAWLRQLFTARQEMRDEVARRAREAFFDQRVHHTTGQSGLMIYLSLYERTAAVLADALIVEKLGQPALDQLCADLTTAMRRGDATDALCGCIEEAGRQLAVILPRGTEDRNELHNALVLID